MADDLRIDPLVMRELQAAGLHEFARHYERLIRAVTANGQSPDRVSPFVARVNDEGVIVDRTALPPATRAREYAFSTAPTYTQSDNADGVTVDITVSAHTRSGDGVSINYNAGTVTGLAVSTTYYIYCDDPGLQGGAVTYVASTSSADLAASENRIYVGAVTTDVRGSSSPSGDFIFDGYAPVL